MAITSDQRRLSLGELVGVLHELVREQRTGTVFFLADSRHYARIGLKLGRIATVVFGRYKGQEALDHLVQVESGVYSFAENAVGHARELPLPPTNLLIQWLYDSALARDGERWEAAPPADIEQRLGLDAADESPAVECSQEVDEDVGPARDLATPRPLRLSGEALYQRVKQELALYIGPVAPMVVNGYKLELTTAETQEEIGDLIDELAEGIGDDRRIESFKDSIMRLL